MLAGIIQFRLIVRALPAEMAGLWLLFVTIGSYLVFFDLGMSPTVAREISFSLGARDLTEGERTLRVCELLATLWRMFRIVAGSAGLLCFVLGETVILLHSRYRGNPSVVWAWAIFSMGAALNLLGSTALAVLYGFGDVAAEKIIRCAAMAIGLGLTLTALALHQGILGLAVAWTLQSIVGGLFGWRRLRSHYPEFLTLTSKPNWALARTLVSPSLKLASIQLGAIFILQSADPLIAILVGTAAIPSYEAVSKIAATIMSLALLIVNSSSPYLSMAYAAGEYEKLTLLLIRNVRLGVGFIIVLAAFIAVNGDRIISLWLGPSMFAGFPVLWILLTMALLEVHHVIFATATMATGQIVFVWSALASGILNIVLAVVLAGRLGLPGIALAVAIGQLLTNNWYAPYVAMRYFRIPAALLVREVWIPMCALLALQVAADALIRRASWLAGASIGAVSASWFLSTALGAGMWWILALHSEERIWIVDYVSAAFPRLKMERA